MGRFPILASVVALGLIGQTTPSPGGDATSIATLIAQIGLSAVFLWQWRDERRERRELQQTLVTFIERFGPALEASTATLAKVQESLSEQVDRVTRTYPSARQPYVDPDLEASIEQLRASADDLGSLIRLGLDQARGRGDRDRGGRGG